MAPFTSEHPQFWPHWREQTTEAKSPLNSNNDDNLPKYTSILFEKGQGYGEVPEHTSSMASVDHPQFKVTIRDFPNRH